MKKYESHGLRKSITLILFICAVLSVLSGCNVTDMRDMNNTDIINNIDNSVKVKNNVTANIVGANTESDGRTQKQQLIIPKDYISGLMLSVQPRKTRTIMVYMNGSDLESQYAAATDDLYEMLGSKFDSKKMNLVIFTGGAKRWHTPGVPNNLNAIFKIDNGRLIKLAQIGKDPMGYPETLAGFINFGSKLFPADKYGLIFWNHGGGSIVGYGSDERYINPNKAMMKLSEIDAALGSTNLYANDKKFEFIGFDTCLMATLKMACIGEKYADYMVASEELEPDPGWDYYFMGDIKPNDSGREIGKLVVDYYRNFYNNWDISDVLTMSLTDLSKMHEVAATFEDFAASAKYQLANGNYSYISKARGRSRMFGSMGEFAGETDMIDTGNLAQSLKELLPDESGTLLSELNDAVIYKYEANIKDLGGLSIYFPFANKKDLIYNMDVYKSINQLPEYTDFLDKFCSVLDSRPLVNYRTIADTVINHAEIINLNSDGNIKTGEYNISLTPEQVDNLLEVRQTTWRKNDVDNSYIQIEEDKNVSVSDDGEVGIKFNDVGTTLNGRFICLYELGVNNGWHDLNNKRIRYAIPVKLNDSDADLIAVYSDKYPDGKIIGAVPAGDDVYNILDKKIVPIRAGDNIQILYYAETFGEDNNSELDSLEVNDRKRELWQKGEEFTVDENGLLLQKEKLQEGEYLCGVSFVDIQQNKYYSNFIEIENRIK
ncbi:MAG: clostripain-related cysteine peptidase [Oscillospiraceae bacterium]|nr:clostripain-related cysteine peptidase [Oscillospiraceae bacterium]